MDVRETAASLSAIEISTLKALSDGREKSESAIAGEGKINEDSVRRAVAWLSEKKLLKISERSRREILLSEEGKKSLKIGLPEKRMLEVLKKKAKISFEDCLKESKLSSAEFNIALGLNKKKAFIVVVKEGSKTLLELTEVAKEFMQKKDEIEELLKKISAGNVVLEELPENEKNTEKELLRRALILEKEKTERTALINESGKKALEIAEKSAGRIYDVQGAVPILSIGKKHPYMQFLLQIRRKLTELGFKEMEVPLIVQEFYNFDVLFQPQNHPARSWSDTYQLKFPKYGKLPARKIVDAVKSAHENGAKTGSIGWRYDWSEKIASRLMPNAHGTSGSAMQLVKGVEIPGKYFAIARCYRPDVVDATHLNEFNQMEGIIIDESFNFKNLLGMLKQFAKEIAGAEEVKFYPDYYPFTEPSVQLSAKHPDLGWIEFGGAGIFRPEMCEPIGVKAPVLAWGLGIDRLAMFKLGINDIRQLFSHDVQWLRNSKAVRG